MDTIEIDDDIIEMRSQYVQSCKQKVMKNVNNMEPNDVQNILKMIDSGATLEELDASISKAINVFNVHKVQASQRAILQKESRFIIPSEVRRLEGLISKGVSEKEFNDQIRIAKLRSQPKPSANKGKQGGQSDGMRYGAYQQMQQAFGGH
jgi:hypothetical protein